MNNHFESRVDQEYRKHLNRQMNLRVPVIVNDDSRKTFIYQLLALRLAVKDLVFTIIEEFKKIYE